MPVCFLRGSTKREIAFLGVGYHNGNCWDKRKKQKYSLFKTNPQALSRSLTASLNTQERAFKDRGKIINNKRPRSKVDLVEAKFSFLRRFDASFQPQMVVPCL